MHPTPEKVFNKIDLVRRLGETPQSVTRIDSKFGIANDIADWPIKSD